MTTQTIMDTMTHINGEGSHHFMDEHPFQVADDSRDKTWSRIELYEIADKLLNDRIEYGQAFTAFIFLNGKIKEDQPPLGTEILGVSFIFVDLMDDGVARVGQTSAPNIGRAEVERAVAIHEFGHAIGLVDSGIPMLENRIPPEEDDPCQCHSDQPDSVMYHSVSNYQAALEHIVQDGSQLPYTFNDSDWRDIRSFQEANSR